MERGPADTLTLDSGLQNKRIHFCCWKPLSLCDLLQQPQDTHTHALRPVPRPHPTLEGSLRSEGIPPPPHSIGPLPASPLIPSLPGLHP